MNARGAVAGLIVAAALAFVVVQALDPGTNPPPQEADASHGSTPGAEPGTGPAANSPVVVVPEDTTSRRPVVSRHEPRPPARDESFERGLGSAHGVVLRDGAPMEGVSILLRPSGVFDGPLAASVFRDTQQGAATTDADGVFRIEGLWPQPATLVKALATLTEPDGHTATVEVPWPGLQFGQSADLGRIEFPASRTIRGRVVTADGNPAAGVRVRAIQGRPADDPRCMILVPSAHRVYSPIASAAGTYFPAHRHRTARTDDDGTFTFESMTSAGATILACPHDPDRPSAFARIEAGAAAADAGDLRLGSATLAGRTVDPSGRPLAGVDVLVTCGLEGVRSANRIAHHAATSSSDGTFRIEGIVGDTVFVATRRNQLDWWVQGPFEPGEAIDLLAADGYEVRFAASTTDGSEPPKRFEITIGPVRHSLAPQTTNRQLVPRDVTWLSDGVAIGGLPKRSQVWIAADAGASAAFSMFSVPAVSEPVLLVFDQPTIRVHVTDPAGRPIEHASVQVRPAGPANRGVSGRVFETDDHGDVTFFPFAPADLFLDVTHPYFGAHRQQHSRDDHDIHVVLGHFGWLTGRVHYAKGVTEKSVSLLARMLGAEGGTVSNVSYPIRPHPDGRYWLSRIPTGEYRVLPGLSANENWDITPDRVEVPALASKEVDIFVTPAAGRGVAGFGTIRGSVALPVDSIDGLLGVTAFRSGQTPTWSRVVDGHFELHDVPAGPQSLILRLNQLDLTTKHVTVLPDESMDVVLEPRMALVRGRLVAPRGVPADSYAVWAGYRKHRVASDGSFEFLWTDSAKETRMAPPDILTVSPPPFDDSSFTLVAVSDETPFEATRKLEIGDGGTFDIVLEPASDLAVAWRLPPGEQQSIQPNTTALARGPEHRRLRYFPNHGFATSRPLKPGTYRVAVGTNRLSAFEMQPVEVFPDTPSFTTLQRAR